MFTSARSLSFLPRLPPQHVPRPRLRDALLRDDHRLRLLLAPLGSGKTVLMGECARVAPAGTAVVWLALGGRALTGEALCRRLAEALGLAHSDEASLHAHLRDIQQPLWIMLDDYPREPDSGLDASLDRLLALASPQVGWWLASRRRPACNLARLLLEGELLELDAAALGMDAQELGELLERAGRHWSAELQHALLEHTGGWCAGVRLRLLGLPIESDPPLPAQLAEAGRALLQEYLQREVLDELPEPLADVLCGLARLNRCCAALAGYLFEDAPGALSELLARGACFQAEEGASGWYRVTPMLAAQLAEMGRTPASSLHRRACQWYSQAGDMHAAFEHSLRAEQPDVAASLLQRLTEEQLLQGHSVERVLRLREELPADLLHSTPRLLILNAWALLFVGRLDEAEALLEHFARFLPMPNEARQRAMLAQWQGLAGMLAHARGRPGARELLQGALDELPQEAWAQTLICLSALSQLALADGQLEEARLINREALKLAREQGSRLFEAYLEIDRAYWLEQRGELSRAETLLRRVQESLLELRQGGCAMTGRVQLRRGWLCLRQGREGEARALLQAGLREARRSLDPCAIYGYIGLAMLDARDDDFDSAFNRLLDAERQMQLRHVPETLYRGTLLLASGALSLRRGRPAQAREVLGRVLARYRCDGLSAPAATPDLVFRVECQLALAESYDGQPGAALARLSGMLPVLEQQGRMALVCEVWLALAETYALAGQPEQAQLARAEGLELVQRFGLEAALLDARQRQPELFAQATGHELPPLLSLRELSVLELIARGCSNLEIGERLFISLHTVKTHARRINGKLGVERRTQAVARAKELGLLKA
ncbi:LuxR C-terminal-related transcriptional regulator [Pseudomonas panipatensis]|uniref:ATP-, maltotriose-and DNA-dependent transcriptional regulator MalT n=1 Tax=Pseudomonas panipatensis TaxID=428992 RepID=A0A1G8E2W5_9PSED|nr:LuxR C-terminal-related transcriptional regulator [Pseudomonas panipatensis]SDH64191.1 ATP-, maltotriose-and DNA-dependent transcriptional regulator MalT [Pseudomonas panipatensis]SMP38758.1 ATP-, maltotriose-and DNA-dependent transcriptional regulator MalT [Pseudomonas panipatensis]